VVDRFSFVHRVLTKLILLLFVFVVPACEILPTLPAPVSGMPTCVPATTDANPYIHAIEEPSSQSSTVRDLYILSFMDLVGARQKALVQLGGNAEHLSDRVDLASNDTNMVRITITYLDPVLIQYIVLNHLLNRPDRTTDPVGTEDFDQQLKEIMKNLGGRNEMLFLVTITSPFYRAQAYNSNVLTVQIPIKEMILINGSDREVEPTHADYVLGENIDITHGPVSGIVGYPIAVMEHDQCMGITDQWTTTFNLKIPRIKLGEHEFDTRIWIIPYRSLVMQDDSSLVPTYDPRMMTPVGKLDSPPIPSWTPNAQVDTTNWTTYWEDMGRYIWNYVVNESHH